MMRIYAIIEDTETVTPKLSFREVTETETIEVGRFGCRKVFIYAIHHIGPSKKIGT